jgi:two-component system, NarL family, response regulator NreC
MDKIRILLADDHTILREGIRSLLEKQADFEVVAEAENGRQAVDLVRQFKPDVVLMDIAMPLLNGIHATDQIRRETRSTQILILSQHESDEYIRRALAVGASGFLLKDTDSTELVKAIRAVHKGESILSPAVTRLVIEDYLRWGDIRPQETSNGLTARESEILQLIAEGNTNKQIAVILCISIKTVQAHRSNLMKKLDLHNKGELIKYAIQKKIIEI